MTKSEFLNMSKAKALSLILVLALMVSLIPIVATSQSVSANPDTEITSLPFTADTANETYYLSGDLATTNAGDAGITIAAEGITINGNGYSITGIMPATCGGVEAAPAACAGVVNTAYDNVIVQDLEITGFCTGIVIGQNDTDIADYMTVTGCKIHYCGQSDATTHGIHMVGASYCTISQNEIYSISGEGASAGCGGGGNGIFSYGISDPLGTGNVVTCNYLHDNAKSGLFAKKCSDTWTVQYNIASNNAEGGIVPMCKKSSNWVIEYNVMTGNGSVGYMSQASNNVLRYNTIQNNGTFGIKFVSDYFEPYGMNNSATWNTISGHTVDIYQSGDDNDTNYAANNTGDSSSNIAGTPFAWDSSNLVNVYYDYDGDTYFSQATCTPSNILEVGTCCNPGKFASAGFSSLQSVVPNGCQTTEGNDPCDCDSSIVPPPDLVITEKSEAWVNEAAGTYEVTYTVKNIGAASAAASTTSISIDETEEATDSVPALVADATHTNTVGPFTLTGTSDTVKVCADKDNAVDEGNEDNNCLENTYQPSLPDLVITEKYETLSGSSYTVTYTVKNVGNASAAASTTSLWIDDVEQTETDSVPALAADATYEGTFDGPFTISDDADTIKVCADKDDAVNESDETNNCLENVLSAKNHSGTMRVHKNLVSEISIEIVTTDVNGDLNKGDNCIGESEDARFIVRTNGKYMVNASGENGGYMTEWNGSSYGSRALINPLHVYQTDNCAQVSNPPSMGGELTTIQTLVVDNDCMGQDGNTGETYRVRFTQLVELGDDVLTPPWQYSMTVTFTAMYTGPADPS